MESVTESSSWVHLALSWTVLIFNTLGKCKLARYFEYNSLTFKLKAIIWARGHKTFSMLNLTEHEISTAFKN